MKKVSSRKYNSTCYGMWLTFSLHFTCLLEIICFCINSYKVHLKLIFLQCAFNLRNTWLMTASLSYKNSCPDILIHQRVDCWVIIFWCYIQLRFLILLLFFCWYLLFRGYDMHLKHGRFFLEVLVTHKGNAHN